MEILSLRLQLVCILAAGQHKLQSLRQLSDYAIGDGGCAYDIQQQPIGQGI